MSDQNFNIHQKVKEKLDAHEFDFNPAAWDNLNGLLDGKRTPDKSYFKTKMIIAMTTLLFFLSLLLWQGDQFDSSQSPVFSPQSPVPSPQSAATGLEQQTPFETSPKPQLQTPRMQLPPDSYRDTENPSPITNQPSPVTRHPSPVTHHPSPITNHHFLPALRPGEGLSAI